MTLTSFEVGLATKKSNLAGGSYGTRVVLVYMRRHPKRVRTAVLNGIAPPHRNSYLYAAAYLQDALGVLSCECRDDPDCASRFPDFDEQFEALLNRFRDGPVDVKLSFGNHVSFSLFNFGYAIRGLLYQPSSPLREMVDEAHRSGDISPFATYYLDRASWVRSEFSTGMHLSVLCSENLPYSSPEEIRRVTESTFLGDELYRQYQQAGEVWPRGDVPAKYHDPVRSDVPVLIFSGEHDPVSPPGLAEETALHLSRSLHVVAPGAGHASNGKRERLRRSITRTSSLCTPSKKRTAFTS